MKKEIEKILNKKELSIIKKLSTPHKIQDFLDKIPFNFEVNGETYWSPRVMLRSKKAHCFEAAVFAVLCLKYHKYKSSLLDLKVCHKFRRKALDSDHVVAIFEMNNHLGAVSKTNHGVLRWRDPIYRSIRELAMSYFHEYFIKDGTKTLLAYSKPFDPFKKFGVEWVVKETDLDQIALALDQSPHNPFVPYKLRKFLRKAGKIEIRAADVEEW